MSVDPTLILQIGEKVYSTFSLEASFEEIHTRINNVYKNVGLSFIKTAKQIYDNLSNSSTIPTDLLNILNNLRNASNLLELALQEKKRFFFIFEQDALSNEEKYNIYQILKPVYFLQAYLERILLQSNVNPLLQKSYKSCLACLLYCANKEIKEGYDSDGEWVEVHDPGEWTTYREFQTVHHDYTKSERDTIRERAKREAKAYLKKISKEIDDI